MAAALPPAGPRLFSGSGSGSSPGPASASPPLGPELLERYQACLRQGKEQARGGELRRSLELLSEAWAIWPSRKVGRRLERLEEALAQLALEEEAEAGEEEQDEFVAVPGCGLSLYRGLYELLYPHQREGVAFLHRLWAEGRTGGILADDMGLGKTVQVIAFLSGMFDAELVRCCLLLMPTTLIGNWLLEFAKWTPGMRVKEFHGTKSERTKNLEKVQRRGGVVITTYQMLINNWQQLSSFDGREFTWDYIILDEAHKIKTKSAKTTKCAYAIPAKGRILLTGTPVQNNLQEMWSLFDFACQGSLLGTSKTFKMEYENPITRAREKDATPGEKALGLRIAENLMKTIQPYFLRRTKENVQKERNHSQANSANKAQEQKSSISVQMPSLTRKNDLIVWVHLSPIQEEIYKKFVSSDQIQELLQTKRSPLVQLTYLKKLCDHPRLLSKRICQNLGLDGSGDPDHLLEGDEGDEGGALSDISNVPDDELVRESGKLVFLLALLERLREEGKRTLVFSQSRKMLDIIQRILSNRGFVLMRVDGTMALPERQKKIETFQRRADYSVFLLTTQVGGVGLTLTAANRVVIFDPSWNPATDAQAVDRAYRIGQTDNVVIYRLITCGSVEEKIYRRQVFKDSLIRQSVGERKNPFRYFSSQELRELFLLEDTRTSTTQRQLQSMHASQRQTDSALDQHIAFLHTLEMFGVTDHDLIYSQDVSPDEENAVSDPEARHYIQQRVRKAQELVAAESQLHQQLVQSNQANTEPTWLNRPRDPPTIQGRGQGSKTPKSDSTITVSAALSESPQIPSPVTVDLTQPIDEGTGADVLNLSCRLAALPIGTGEQDDSVVLLDSFQSPVNTDTTRGGGGDCLTPGLTPAASHLPDVNNKLSPALKNSFQKFYSDGQDAEMSTSEFNSSASKPLFQSDFNLVLEETIEEGEDPESEGRRAARASEMLLAVDASDFSTEAAQGEAGAAGPFDQDGELSISVCGQSYSLGEESPLVLQPRKKSRGQVIVSDSEEETEACPEPRSTPGMYMSSPVPQAFGIPTASTPKGLNSPLLALLSRSGNRSVASRRSLVSAVIDDVEDMDEGTAGSVCDLDDDGDDVGDGVFNISSQSDGEGSVGGKTKEPGESQLESGSVEEPPSEAERSEMEAESGDLGVSESSGSIAVSNVELESEEDQSGTFDPELGSDEQVETFTTAVDQPAVLDTCTAGKGKGQSEPALDEYEGLVKRGKEQMERGELKAALNCLLQALDLKSGDPEVQLTTIKLYRLLDQS